MNKMIRTICSIAEEEIGKGNAERIAMNAQGRLEELKQENTGDSKALWAHTYTRIYQSGKSTTPDRLDQTRMNCLNLFDAEYNV